MSNEEIREEVEYLQGETKNMANLLLKFKSRLFLFKLK